MRTCHQRLSLVVIAALALAFPVLSQEVVAPSNPSGTMPSKLMPPPLPTMRSPVALFRDLLAMNHQQREQFLAARPAESRQMIEAKLKEYEALSPEECELRLLVTELRYFLLPLMSVTPTNRAAQLALAPEELRPMIQVRLESWDLLPAEKQRELLENEKAIRYLAEIASSPPEQHSPTLTNLPPAQRQALNESIQKWQQLSESQRAAITTRFERYFALRPQEQESILGTLSKQERTQIEKTLQTFYKLEPGKRAQCIRALDKLSQLTPAQRQEFFQNASRWEMMKPEERKAWRDLVVNVSRQPPLPPGLNRVPYPPVPRPPLPPPAGSADIATNR